MRGLIRYCLVIVWSAAAWAQQGGLLSNRELLASGTRAVELMESTSVTVPGLVTASAPLIENARQAVLNLRAISPQHGALTHTLLVNLRAYLTLADGLPKPHPFPEEGRKQFLELRDQLNGLETHFRALLEQKELALRNPDRDNLLRYAQANEKLPPPQPGRVRVVFLGDSITDGWRLNEYFPERDFVNRGISGQITGEMLGRMKADVLDLKPEAVLVLAGTNDIGRGVPLRVIENNLTMIADLAQAHKIKLLFASLLPVSDYHQDQNPAYEQSKRRPPESIRALNSWLQSFCRQRNLLYVDYFPAVADQAGLFQADLSDDGLHPNSAGYRVMAPVALSAIDKALPAVPPKPVRRR